MKILLVVVFAAAIAWLVSPGAFSAQPPEVPSSTLNLTQSYSVGQVIYHSVVCPGGTVPVPGSCTGTSMPPNGDTSGNSPMPPTSSITSSNCTVGFQGNNATTTRPAFTYVPGWILLVYTRCEDP